MFLFNSFKHILMHNGSVLLKFFIFGAWVLYISTLLCYPSGNIETLPRLIQL